MNSVEAKTLLVFGNFLNSEWQANNPDLLKYKEFTQGMIPDQWKGSSYIVELLNSPMEDNSYVDQSVNEAKKYAFTLLSAIPKIYDLLEEKYNDSSVRDVDNSFIAKESLDIAEEFKESSPIFLKKLLLKIENYEHLLWKAVQAYKFKARDPRIDEHFNKKEIVNQIHRYLMEKKVNLYRESIEEAYGSSQ